MMLSPPNVIESALIGKFRQVESIIQQRVLGLARPRPRKSHQMYAAKFHFNSCRASAQRILRQRLTRANVRIRAARANFRIVLSLREFLGGSTSGAIRPNGA